MLERAVRWWPAPVAVLLVVYASAMGSPYVAESPVLDRTIFYSAAFVWLLVLIWPRRPLRLAGLWVTACASIGRAAVLVLNPPVLSVSRQVAGVALWLLVTVLVLGVVVFSELLESARRRAEGAWSETS